MSKEARRSLLGVRVRSISHKAKHSARTKVARDSSIEVKAHLTKHMQKAFVANMALVDGTGLCIKVFQKQPTYGDIHGVF